ITTTGFQRRGRTPEGTTRRLLPRGNNPTGVRDGGGGSTIPTPLTGGGVVVDSGRPAGGTFCPPGGGANPPPPPGTPPRQPPPPPPAGPPPRAAPPHFLLAPLPGTPDNPLTGTAELATRFGLPASPGCTPPGRWQAHPARSAPRDD